MTTLSDFRIEHVLPIIKRIQNGAQHLLATTEVIPLCGVILYRGFDGEDAIGNNYTFYLAAENGETVKHEDTEDTETIHDQIFDTDKARRQVATLLGIAPDQIGFSEGDEKYENEDYENYDLVLRWKFLYLSIAEFERLRKPKKISVVAERGYEKPVQRWVAPNALRVRDAKFDFDPATMKLQFVAKHNNSIEYVTDTGIKVFDNRRCHIGFGRGGIYDTGKGEPIIIRENCLEKFIYNIWRGHKAKRSANKETEQLRDYAGWALQRLALHANDVARKEGHIIAEGIRLLYGEPFIPAVEIFGEWYTKHGNVSLWNKRMFLRDADNSDAMSYDDNKLSECYVVLTD